MQASEDLAKIKTPSKTGFAREYVRLLEDVEELADSDAGTQRAVNPAIWVKDNLEIRALAEEPGDVLGTH